MLEVYREVQDISLDYVITILEKVRVNAQDVQHLMWLDYDEAKLLIVAGRNEEARKLIIPILKRKKSEPWAWGALAASYRKEDDNKAITLFSKGIICAHDEKFSLKLLKGIAPLLAKAGFDQEASMCVIRLLNWYESNGYKIKPDLESLANQPWFNSSVDVTSLNAFFEEKSAQALNLLNGPTKKKVGLVMSLHKSGKANIPGVEVIEGNLRLSDKGFGFVDDTFISPDLLEPDMDGQHLKVMRVKGFDKKKNQPGWRAVKVELMKD